MDFKKIEKLRNEVKDENWSVVEVMVDEIYHKTKQRSGPVSLKRIVIWHSVEDELPQSGKHVWIANKANKGTARIRWGTGDEAFYDYWAYSPNPSPPKDK